MAYRLLNEILRLPGTVILKPLMRLSRRRITQWATRGNAHQAANNA
jgi:hypothetical protein